MSLVENCSLKLLLNNLKIEGQQFKIEIPTLRMEGKCNFTQLQDEVLCQELYKDSYSDFVMSLSKNRLTFKRRDNQPLHEFKFNGTGYPMVAHNMYFCGQDTYYCEMTIFSHMEFQLEYNVNGPRKNYTFIKRYYQP